MVESGPSWSSSHGESPDVVIIGAGLSGICTAIDLIKRDKTIKFLIVEKGNQIGGTWNDNKYPGCCCDVWSHLYSLSFEPNPDWTREYPGQEEIHAYLKKIAQKWGLYDRILFNTAVEESRWHEFGHEWHTRVKVSGGKAAEFGEEYVIKSNYLVSAVGQLNVPNYPEFEGMSQFRGTVMHSARWNRSKPIDGLKIGIIGNGATAAQILPEIAKTANHVTIFQRTPNWVIPRNDQWISSTRRALYRYIPPIRRRYRAALMDFRESFYDAAAVEDSKLNNEIRKLCLEQMRTQLNNKPHLSSILTPEYPPGCKRIIISDDYFPAIDRPNVTLETSPIKTITSTGIAVQDQEIDLDVIVLATGFRTVEFMFPIKIFGENGRSIDEIWSQGARAYLGVTVESLPNFAMLYGPNTNLGHNSIILMIEAAAKYATEMIAEVKKAKNKQGSLKIVPSGARVATYNEEIQSRLQASTFASNLCRSWYKTPDGLITNNWCGNVIEYQERVSAVHWADYNISGAYAHEIANKGKTYIGRVVEESTKLPLITGLGTVALLAASYLASTRLRH